jgi:ABC-type transporter Mla subunit MlaD
LALFEEPPAAREYRYAEMSRFGNVPSDALIDAVEKHVETMNEDDLASLLRSGLGSMPRETTDALLHALFDAFRDRGESSDDVAEAADAPLAAIEAHDPAAFGALLAYARSNTGLLEDALMRLAEEHHDQLGGLPAPLVDGIAAAL